MELKELSALVDLYQTTRALRLAEEKQAKGTKVLEDEYKAVILATLKDTEVPTIGGTTHTAERVVKDEPTADDWDIIHEHILATNEWDLIQRRLGTAAVKLRWDEGTEVPGVIAFPVESLSLTKHR